MKKIILLSLSIVTVLICGCKSVSTDTFQQRLEKYVEANFSYGYYCDSVAGHKYFFDVVFAPYKNTGEYLVSFNLGGYAPTKLGNITSCGGGGANLIVRDDGSHISLVYKFADFPEAETRKDDVLLLPKNELNTTYQQAKVYFHIDDNKVLDQNCVANLCDKTRYIVVPTSVTDYAKPTDDQEDGVDTYTTIAPTEAASGRWTLSFSSGHIIKETNRECVVADRCVYTGVWKFINTSTIAYPLWGDVKRSSRFEIVDITENQLKIRRLFE